MSAFTLKESNAYYKSKLNTYTFTIVSGVNTSDKLNLQLPPFPLPTHQRSSLAILKLKEFWVFGQDCNNGTERASGDLTADISGFIVSLKGIGLRGTNLNNLQDQGGSILPTTDFVVINKYANVDLVGGTAPNERQRCSGNSDLTQEVVCSNPTGTSITIEVRNLDTNNLITPDIFQFSLRFDVEVLPDEVSRGDIN